LDSDKNEGDICRQIKIEKMGKKENSDNEIHSEAESADYDLFQRRLELQSKVLKQMIAKVDSHVIDIENSKSEEKNMNVLSNDA